ncbi:DUF4167 domain-containing protein [Limibaculum sp. FT325]|uniref:DUF4167 domain-containing protein n=1 Tax=Thermohalobaculum sediminis TaxID=2939436 RepID=UPI0020BEA10A|nr:DUF4167 domain-containing protein [Limibaculum sediminis]MCL5778541.1 DUF4167 domain-containing protein [Limibaculum sediminis]
MRQAQKSNRARGRGGRKGGGGGGGNNLNRVYESAGPEGKVRGTPQQIVEKYLGLARDAQTSGDRVTAENFLQHAEHYQRIVLQALGAQEERRENVASDSDDDDDDEYTQPSPHAQRMSEPRQHGGGQHHHNGRDHGGHAASHPAPASEPQPVSSLTTIDLSDEDGADLLVTTESTARLEPAPQAPAAAQPEAAAPAQPRRPRRPRNRRPAEGGEAQQPAGEAAAPARGGGDAD